jgi:hypothetical protein
MHNPFRGGTFDDWYSGNKADIWVEYKWGKNPLSQLQVQWGRERHAEGRRVFVIQGLPDRKGGMLYSTPCQWEKLRGGVFMTKAEIVAWLVGLTMKSSIHDDNSKQ